MVDLNILVVGHIRKGEITHFFIVGMEVRWSVNVG
jgi:hypothetical protein